MKTVDHIGVAVKNLDVSNKLFSKLLGIAPHEAETVEGEGVRVSCFSLANLKIELLEPTREDSPIARFIDRRGEGIHHIAFKVDDIEKETQRQTAKGFTTTRPDPKKGSSDTKTNFFHPKTTNGVLIELCQHDGSGR